MQNLKHPCMIVGVGRINSGSPSKACAPTPDLEQHNNRKMIRISVACRHLRINDRLYLRITPTERNANIVTTMELSRTSHDKSSFWAFHVCRKRAGNPATQQEKHLMEESRSKVLLVCVQVPNTHRRDGAETAIAIQKQHPVRRVTICRMHISRVTPHHSRRVCSVCAR